MINIKGRDKAEVLALLYNHSQPLGMGILHFTPEDMTVEQAQKLIDASGYIFDYLKGRVMKVNLSGDEFDERWYDRDNGQGAAAMALNKDSFE